MTDQKDQNSIMDSDTMETLAGTLFPGEQLIDSHIYGDNTMEISDRIETYLGMTDSEKKSLFRSSPQAR